MTFPDEDIICLKTFYPVALQIPCVTVKPWQKMDVERRDRFILHIRNLHQEILLRKAQLLMQSLSLGEVQNRMKVINQ